MSRNPLPFQGMNKKNTLNVISDQNLQKNMSMKTKFTQNKQYHKYEYPRAQEKPITIYKLNEQSQKYQKFKWEFLDRFFNKVTKASRLFKCKQQTLFAAYSLAQKTVSLVIQNKIQSQYWVICCLYLAMKFQQIYPPRLKELSCIYKNYINVDNYNRSQFIILDKIGLDMNFVNINILISEFIHQLRSDQEKSYFYYLIQLALYQRSLFKKYTLKQIIYGIVYVLASRSLYFSPKQLLAGLLAGRIQECTKIIIVMHTNAYHNSSFIYKKYNQSRYHHVSMKPIPNCQSMTKVIMNKKSKSSQQISKVVPLNCKKPYFNSLNIEKN